VSEPAGGARPAAACEVHALTKRFGSRVALDGVSFTLGRGELVGLVGPNGAGKTTLLSVLAGVLPPDGGSLSLSGAVGWVPQAVALYSRLSVAENLRLFARLERVGDVEAAVARMLEQTGLADRAEEAVARLSGGNRQRVNIALGLLADPAVLLLDEPTAALDPEQRERLWEFVGSLAAQDTAVLFSSHELSEVERHAGRVLALRDGRLCAG
jgi:ABC-2 type transport system ATP-binding protein